MSEAPLLRPTRPHSRNASALLRELAERQGNRLFIIDGETAISYAAFDALTDRWAAHLLQQAAGRGTRIGILMGNRWEWLAAYFAGLRLGAEMVALNTWLTGPELAYQLRHAKVRILIAEESFMGRNWPEVLSRQSDETANQAGQPALPALETVLWLASVQPSDALDGMGPGGGSWRNQKLVPQAIELSVPQSTLDAVGELEAAIDPTDTACILYTSGSTATAKGVPLLHGGLIDNMWCIGERMHLTETDRLWLGVSLFWSFACVNAVFTLMTHGGSIVLQHHFAAPEAIALMARHGCTVFYGTPNMVEALHDACADAGAGEATLLPDTLRTGATIGSPEQLRRAIALGIPEICNVYGLTEAYGNSAVTDARSSPDYRTHHQGPVLEAQILRIVDPATRARLPAGETGEIELGGCVTPGYLDDPERTAKSFTADGFLRTGDLGRLDERGHLQYRGRLKEMIKTGGINVAPAEVEEQLSAFPGVKFAFVLGLPDPKRDEVVAAVIVPEGRKEAVDEKALEAHCRAALAAYKIPRRWRFCTADDLPQTATGKLQRNRLGELFV